MATGTIINDTTKKEYTVSMATSQYVAPFKTFGATTQPYTDQLLYGGIVALIPADSSAVAGIDLTTGRVMMSGLSTGDKTIIVVFSKSAPAS